mmetsp:Transcript_118636/g.308231  ORF Transcript_118636/g.308231 Transcript_118636/m.308231 type:complete len:340 (+) Transcript_118636:48-1067(+)
MTDRPPMSDLPAVKAASQPNPARPLCKTWHLAPHGEAAGLAAPKGFLGIVVVATTADGEDATAEAAGGERSEARSRDDLSGRPPEPFSPRPEPLSPPPPPPLPLLPEGPPFPPPRLLPPPSDAPPPFLLPPLPPPLPPPPPPLPTSSSGGPPLPRRLPPLRSPRSMGQRSRSRSRSSPPRRELPPPAPLPPAPRDEPMRSRSPARSLKRSRPLPPRPHAEPRSAPLRLSPPPRDSEPPAVGLLPAPAVGLGGNLAPTMPGKLSKGKSSPTGSSAHRRRLGAAVDGTSAPTSLTTPVLLPSVPSGSVAASATPAAGDASVEAPASAFVPLDSFGCCTVAA